MTVVRPEKLEELERRLKSLGVRESDLVEKFVRAGGPGGQKVNKASVAVYLRHVPTGIEVKAQDGRSQVLNRFLARRRLAEQLEQRDAGGVGADPLATKIRRQKARRKRRAKSKL